MLYHVGVLVDNHLQNLDDFLLGPWLHEALFEVVQPVARPGQHRVGRPVNDLVQRLEAVVQGRHAHHLAHVLRLDRVFLHDRLLLNQLLSLLGEQSL